MAQGRRAGASRGRPQGSDSSRSFSLAARRRCDGTWRSRRCPARQLLLLLPASRSTAAAQAIAKQPSGDAELAVRTEGGTALRLPASECCLANERDDTVDDLVRSDFLHEPG